MHLIPQDPMLRVERLKKVFRSGDSDLVLFENLSFAVRKGEMLAIVGESGAGKSTLLHILGALERASDGNVYCANLQLNSLADDAAADFRNREIGFVWQFHYLLPEFTALENAAMPLLLRRQPGQPCRMKRRVGCVKLGLRHVRIIDQGSFRAENSSAWLWPAHSSPSRKLLLADEPTGDLDGRTAESIFELIARLHRDYQLTSLIATHNLAFARRCHRVFVCIMGTLRKSYRNHCQHEYRFLMVMKRNARMDWKHDMQWGEQNAGREVYSTRVPFVNSAQK